jgi:hypothetical protein
MTDLKENVSNFVLEESRTGVAAFAQLLELGQYLN